MQIQSSFIMNSSSKPADVLSSSLMWISPIRSGPHWINSYWIQFDFLTVMRLTRFSLLQPDLMRVVTSARFDWSNSGSSFNRGKVYQILSGVQVTFDQPIRARFLRMVITETNDVTENTKPIAINGFKVFGCEPEVPI